LTSSWTPIPATDDDEDSIIELEQIAWGSAEEATHEYFQWCLKDPAGRSITYVVKDDFGKVVSMHVVVPLPAIIDGKLRLAGISINVVTHPDHRRKGLSNRIAAAIYAEAAQSGIQFLFTLPNSMSDRLFMKKNNFVDLGKPPLLVRWVDPGIFVKHNGFPRAGKLISSWTKLVSTALAREKQPVSCVRHVEELETLRLDELLEPANVCFALDGNWLKWRYREHPFRRYECAIVGEPADPKALVVYHVLQSSKRALVMEFLTGQKTPQEDVQALMCVVAAKCKAMGCSSLCCLGPPNSRNTNWLRRSGFWAFPFDSVWRPRIVAKDISGTSTDFSFASLNFSFGTLINME
jgi:GNAT superfamily N-acetyltransferase